MDRVTRNLRRFFVEQLPAEAGAEVQLSRDEAHHALNVLRLAAGQEVELFDGRGGAAAGRIGSAGRGEVCVAIEQAMPRRSRQGAVVHLGFAVPKGRRLDWLLEKATELGAASLQPVLFERSVAGQGQLSEGKRRRWAGHCVAAAKQCGLDWLPQLHEPATLAELLDRWRAELKIVGEAGEGSSSIAGALAGRHKDQAVGLLIGPEGGLTESEDAAVREGGFVSVRLGATTLRIETAAVAMLAATVALCAPNA